MRCRQPPNHIVGDGLRVVTIALGASTLAAAVSWGVIAILVRNVVIASVMSLIPMMAALMLTYGFNRDAVLRWLRPAERVPRLGV